MLLRTTSAWIRQFERKDNEKAWSRSEKRSRGRKLRGRTRTKILGWSRPSCSAGMTTRPSRKSRGLRFEKAAGKGYNQFWNSLPPLICWRPTVLTISVANLRSCTTLASTKDQKQPLISRCKSWSPVLLKIKATRERAQAMRSQRPPILELINQRNRFWSWTRCQSARSHQTEILTMILRLRR